ncbi:MAG TPA: hypothetical protein ENJ77_01375, partial [Candidatus Moranbacteria bacterium]|nr:hypothetical protein [Candidatus Moranbacteria bacterium]
LREGNSVVVDATFANPDDRQRFIAHLRKSGAEKIQGVFFDTPPEIAKERNLSRERVVPEKVINFMQRSLRDSPPNTFGEFDSLFTLDENAELTAVEKTDRREGFRQIKLR